MSNGKGKHVILTTNILKGGKNNAYKTVKSG